MDPMTEAAAGGSEQAPMTIVTADGDGKLSVAAAARALASARHKPREQEQALEQRLAPASGSAKAGTAGTGVSTAEAVQESSSAPSRASEDAGDLRSPQGEGGPPGETASVDPASSAAAAAASEDLSSIEPPRSWTKADKEFFTSLPRETQERIAERERSREGDFLRRQAEAAEKLKGLTAREQAVDQARLHYETALPQLLLTLNEQQAAEFADIKTLADAERVAREDWPRYMRWDLAQKKTAFAQQQMLEAQQRQVTEQSQRFAQFAKRQDELFVEKVPEFTDTRKAVELQSAAVTVLKDLGFDDAELAASWQGRHAFSLRDHRVQLLVRDATLWREAQQKAKAAVAKPVPPVQRPGVSQPKAAAQDAVIQNLNKQLENASGVNALRTAAKLVAARRETRRA